MLLYWGTLSPPPGSDVVAVRFVSACQIHAIAIFQSGATPFARDRSLVAHTALADPSWLDIFFNAQSVPNPKAISRSRPSNALLHTTLFYFGGHRLFNIEWNVELATRLMIIRGFPYALSLAVYGSIPGDMDQQTEIQRPLKLLECDSVCPSMALDPATSSDPTWLARQLLSHSSTPAPLSVVARLVFCIKPHKEDWNESTFPLYTQLQSLPESVDEVFNMLSTPFSDDISNDNIDEFLDSVEVIFGSCEDYNRPFYFANLLVLLACQGSEVVSRAIGKFSPSLEKVFQAPLTEDTLVLLSDAAVHPDIMQWMKTESMRREWDRNASHSVDSIREAAKALQNRIRGSDAFARLLASCLGDPNDCFKWLLNIITNETALGLWLLAMLEQTTWPLQSDQPSNGRLNSGWWNMETCEWTSGNSEFILFVKALTGIISTLAVFAWADSISDEVCTTKILGIITLWQSVDGYSHIINRILPMSQFTARVKRTMRKTVPSTVQSVIFAEQILVRLSDDLQALSNLDVSYTLRSLHSPGYTLDEMQRDTIVQMAHMAGQELEGVLDALHLWPKSTNDLPHLKFLGLALTLLWNELSRDPSKTCSLMENSGRQRSRRAMSTLLSVQDSLNALLSSQVVVSNVSQSLKSAVFVSALLLMKIYTVLFEHLFFHPSDVAHVTQTATVLFSLLRKEDEGSNNELASTLTSLQEAIIILLRTIIRLANDSESCWKNAERVIRVILEIGVCASVGQIEFLWPTMHAEIVTNLFVEVTSNKEAASEESMTKHREIINETIPRVLMPLRTLYGILDGDNRKRLASHLIRLDDNRIGIADWLIFFEITTVTKALKALSLRSDKKCHQMYITTVESHCDSVLHLLSFGVIGQTSSTMALLLESVGYVSSLRLNCPALARLVMEIAPSFIELNGHYRMAAIRVLLFAVSGNRELFTNAIHSLFTLAHDLWDNFELQQNVEQMLVSLLDLGEKHDPTTVELALSIITRLAEESYIFSTFDEAIFIMLLSGAPLETKVKLRETVSFSKNKSVHLPALINSGHCVTSLSGVAALLDRRISTSEQVALLPTQLVQRSMALTYLPSITTAWRPSTSSSVLDYSTATHSPATSSITDKYTSLFDLKPDKPAST